MVDFTDRIKPDHAAITTYLDDLLRRKYQIPTFQRDVVWDENQVKRLWDSVCRFYPIGSILVWKTDIKLHNHREIGGHVIEIEPTEEDFQYLLDGQQRTTALLTALQGGKIHGKNDFDPTLYIDLTIPFGDDDQEDSYRQRFLFWHEIDDRSGTLLANRGRAERYRKGLVVKLQAVRAGYGQLERALVDGGFKDYEHPVRDALRRIKSVLDNYRVPFIELRGIKVSEVCQIFERVNREGQPLSIFDIVVAKTYRPADPAKNVPEFYLRERFDELRKELPTGSEFTIVDDQTLLQVVATIVGKAIPNSGIQNITDRYLLNVKSEWIDQVWPDTKLSIKKAYDFFDNILGLKGPNLIPFRYFYMTFATYFWKNPRPDYEALKQYFWYTSFHSDDLLANTTQLRQHIDILTSTKKEAGLVGFLRDFRIDKDALRKASYSGRGRLSRAILALLAYHTPKDWAAPFRDVHTAVYYALTDRPNLHHIFPVDFISKNPGKNGVDVNSLMNIAYLTQLTNLKISNKNPISYLSELDVPGFSEVLWAHLVPPIVLKWSQTAIMPDDALDQFVEQRVEMFINRLKELLPGINFSEFDSRVTLSDLDL